MMIVWWIASHPSDSRNMKGRAKRKTDRPPSLQYISPGFCCCCCSRWMIEFGCIDASPSTWQWQTGNNNNNSSNTILHLVSLLVYLSVCVCLSIKQLWRVLIYHPKGKKRRKPFLLWLTFSRLLQIKVVVVVLEMMMMMMMMMMIEIIIKRGVFHDLVY